MKVVFVVGFVVFWPAWSNILFDEEKDISVPSQMEQNVVKIYYRF